MSEQAAKPAVEATPADDAQSEEDLKAERSKRGKRSKNKGRRWEQEVAREVRAIFGPVVLRGNQSRDGAEGADVDGSPFWFECKHEQMVNWRSAMRQAEDAVAEANDARPCVVVANEDKKPPGWKVGEPSTPPMVFMKFDDFLDLVSEWWGIKTEPDLIDEEEVLGKMADEGVNVPEGAGAAAGWWEGTPFPPPALIVGQGTVPLWWRSEIEEYVDNA